MTEIGAALGEREERARARNKVNGASPRKGVARREGRVMTSWSRRCWQRVLFQLLHFSHARFNGTDQSENGRSGDVCPQIRLDRSATTTVLSAHAEPLPAPGLYERAQACRGHVSWRVGAYATGPAFGGESTRRPGAFDY